MKDIKRFRGLVHTYLGGSKHYKVFGRELGIVGGGGGEGGRGGRGSSLLLSQFNTISLTLFVRTADVNSGVFEEIGKSEHIAQVRSSSSSSSSSNH